MYQMPTAIAAGVVPGTATSTGCRIYVILRKNNVEQVSHNSQQVKASRLAGHSFILIQSV